jgi:hypothetical protein
MVDLDMLEQALNEIKVNVVNFPGYKKVVPMTFQMEIRDTFPIIIGSVKFETGGVPEKFRHHKHHIDVMVKNTLDNYFPGVEFMKMQLDVTNYPQHIYIFQLHPLTTDGERMRQSVPELTIGYAVRSNIQMLDDLPLELTSMILKRVNLSKLEMLYFNTITPFPDTMRDSVLIYRSLSTNVANVHRLYPDWKFNWLEILETLEDRYQRREHDLNYRMRVLNQPQLVSLYTLRNIYIGKAYIYRVNIQLAAHFIYAIYDNNLTVAILIASDPRIQELSRTGKKDIDVAGTYARISWGELLLQTLSALLSATKYSATPETYKLMIRLLLSDCEARGETIPNKYFQGDLDKITAGIEGRIHQVKNLLGLEEIHQEMVEVANVWNQALI